MMYGSSVWVSTSVDNLNKVFRLQKRAARVFLNADTRANSVDLFKELSWLPFFHEAKINKCALVHKRLSGVCPDYISELLKQNIDIRSSERRSRYGSLNLICPKHKGKESEGARTFQVLATRFWNSLPNEIKNSSSSEILKKSLYKYFFKVSPSKIKLIIIFIIIIAVILLESDHTPCYNFSIYRLLLADRAPSTSICMEIETQTVRKCKGI